MHACIALHRIVSHRIATNCGVGRREVGPVGRSLSTSRMDDKEEVELHLVGSKAGDPGGGGFE